MQYATGLPDDTEKQSAEPACYSDQSSQQSWRHAAQWRELQPEYHQITKVVPDRSPTLERTTVLTWLYRNRGCMTFLEIVGQTSGDESLTIRKKIARRVLRGLERIGAVTLFQIPDEADRDAATDDSLEMDGDTVQIGRNTAVHLTSAGMLWMHRAFKARAHVFDENRRNSLEWIHAVILEEEEEGKATEPHWIENLTVTDTEVVAKPRDHVDDGYRVPAISNVFDMHLAFAKPKSSKKEASKR
jgi:hypothetical protein